MWGVLYKKTLYLCEIFARNRKTETRRAASRIFKHCVVSRRNSIEKPDFGQTHYHDFVSVDVSAVILGTVLYASFRSVFLRFYNERAQDIVAIVAERTDWDALRPYMETGEMDEYTENLLEYYNSVKTNFRGVGYLYLMVPGDGRVRCAGRIASAGR